MLPRGHIFFRKVKMADLAIDNQICRNLCVCVIHNYLEGEIKVKS